LRATVEDFLKVQAQRVPCPKALVVPHAGYIYSGPVAATAYAQLAERKAEIRRVVLLGPSHRVPFRGLAVPSVDAFATPLGALAIDQAAIARILRLPQVVVSDEAHVEEHSLEVHLPFLQTVLEQIALVPIVVGEATAEEVAAVLDVLWGGEETLIVVSSDLSHYHDYATAKRLDRVTTEAIEALRHDIDPEQACGCRPLNGLLVAAAAHHLSVRTLDLRNSGDTAGTRDRVVGYGAYALA
jgi:AmmeMemoRadiSam system protein B